MAISVVNLKASRLDDFHKLLEDLFTKFLPTEIEAVLQDVAEILLDEPSDRVLELRLVVDESKTSGGDRFEFVDIFIPRNAMAAEREQVYVVMELKCLGEPLGEGPQIPHAKRT
ncbi:hypothetical protein BGX20_006299 [Mortierella sp. AD010]|nr:hypothetical protein BGX20_006299 [Mortierella sp. AD010]